jgi:hypothetical protein
MKVNRNLTKGLILGAAITGLILYMRMREKNKALEESYNEQLNLLQQEDMTGSETANKNEEFIELGDECILIGDLKATFNSWLGNQRMDTNDLYDAVTRDIFKKVMENTTHIMQEDDSLRKMMIYDIVKTNANIVDADLPPYPLKYEYTQGMVALGDKGGSVADLQKLINMLYKYYYPVTEKQISVNSTYDKITAAAAVKLFAGTSALIDEDKAAVSKEFVANMTTMINNLKVIN